MKNIPSPTQQELDVGYQVCMCLKNVHILQAGFECRHIICNECGFSVVSREEFFRNNEAVEILSK